MTTINMRLTFDVSYSANGVSAEKLAEMLRSLATLGIENGLVSGSTDAEVEDYTISVQEKPEMLSSDVLTAFMLERIENGQLGLEDIPTRLAEYGLMEPAAFVEEMHERMANAKGDAEGN